MKWPLAGSLLVSKTGEKGRLLEAIPRFLSLDVLGAHFQRLVRTSGTFTNKQRKLWVYHIRARNTLLYLSKSSLSKNKLFRHDNSGWIWMTWKPFWKASRRSWKVSKWRLVFPMLSGSRKVHFTSFWVVRLSIGGIVSNPSAPRRFDRGFRSWWIKKIVHSSEALKRR